MNTYRFFLISFLGLIFTGLTGFSDSTKKNKNIKTIETTNTAPKVLDLSLPAQIENTAGSKTTTQIKPEFTIKKKKKIQRELEFDTQTIMSMEPEADKIKSVDGASITINLKR
ncbi:MAG: hypothetical protein NTZ45_07320 [Methylococcales bacterium]|nr:hypothetical protein [Methylococcales bacterium]